MQYISERVSDAPWNTSAFQRLMAAIKPRLVMAYNIIGIQGLSRFAILSPRGRVYGIDEEEYAGLL